MKTLECLLPASSERDQKGGEKSRIHVCGWVLFPGLTALGSEPGSMLIGALCNTRSNLSMSVYMYASNDLSSITGSVVYYFIEQASLFWINASPLSQLPHICK
jgi:hypothetical protein